MYCNKDFERLFLRYKMEVLPRGESIRNFCFRNEVPYNLFDKCYKDTRHHLVPVEVTGKPETTVKEKEKEKEKEKAVPNVTSKRPLRVRVDFHLSNGLRIQQGNLTLSGLRQLVDRLEGLYRLEGLC